MNNSNMYSLGKKAEKNYLPMQDGDIVSTYADVSGLINDFKYRHLIQNWLMGLVSLWSYVEKSIIKDGNKNENKSTLTYERKLRKSSK